MGNRISAAHARIAPPQIQPVIMRCRGEVYIFVYTDQTRNEAMRWAGRHAADPSLNFTWADASILSMVAAGIERKEAL